VVKKAGDTEHPNKLHFLSFMVMELLGPSVGYLSLDGAYVNNTHLLVSHGLGMLQVSTRGHMHTLAVIFFCHEARCCWAMLQTP
jgi:hypothetical protein